MTTMKEEKTKYAMEYLKTLMFIKLSLYDKLQEHPLSKEIDKLMENDESYSTAIKEAYLDEICMQIIEDNEGLSKVNKEEIVKEYAVKLDDIYKELTSIDGQEITISLEELQKTDKDFPYHSYLATKLVLRYINVYGLYPIIENLGESNDTVLKLMIFITAFLSAIEQTKAKDTDEKGIQIKEIVYHRSALKDVPNAIKEELK